MTKKLKYFFNNDASPISHVSAPNWFQIFPSLGFRTVSTVAQINSAGADPDVTEAIERWSPMMGARGQMEILRSFYEFEIARREALAEEPEPPSPLGPILPEGSQFDISGIGPVNPLIAGFPTTADRAAVENLILWFPRRQLPEWQLTPSPTASPLARTLFTA